MIKFLVFIMTTFQLFAANINLADISISNTAQTENLKVSTLLTKSKFSVFIALDKDCPILQKYIPTINELNSKFLASDLTVYLIARNSNITTAQIEEFVKSYKIKPTVYLDTDHKLLHALEITTISQAVLIDNKKNVILYSGRIDDKVNYDSVVEYSKNNYLEDAIKNGIAGKKVKIKSVRTLGCSI